MNISDLAMHIYAFVYPYITIGPYTFRRRYLDLVYQGLTEYDFCGITKDMVVMDLGAAVGGFTIAASRKCKYIYAVEPLFSDVLFENLQLNNVNNCTILKYAIGDRRKSGFVEFKGKKKEVQFVPFQDIMSMVNEKIDFLKCDIEGAEIYVNFELFNNIEAEIHEEGKVRIYHKRNGELV